MAPLLGSSVSRKFSGYGNAPWPGTVTRGPDDKGMCCGAWVDPRDRAGVDHQWHTRCDVERWVTRRGPAVVTAPAPARRPARQDARPRLGRRDVERVVAGERAEERRGVHARADPELAPQELVLERALRPAVVVGGAQDERPARGGARARALHED